MMKGLKIMLAGLLVAGACSQANAAARLTIYDGVNPLISILDDGAGDSVLSPGIVFVQTNVGVWFLSISSAVTKPVFGSQTDPIMDLIISANSSAGGSLTFAFSDINFGPAGGTLHATADGHLVSGASAAMVYDVFGDGGNVLGGTSVHIAGTGAGVLPTYLTSSGPLNLNSPFSLTQVLTIRSDGATAVSVDGSFNVVPVPEPAFLGLAALGCAAFAFRTMRGKRA